MTTETWDEYWARLARQRQENIAASTDPARKAELITESAACDRMDAIIKLLETDRG